MERAGDGDSGSGGGGGGGGGDCGGAGIGGCGCGSGSGGGWVGDRGEAPLERRGQVIEEEITGKNVLLTFSLSSEKKLACWLKKKALELCDWPLNEAQEKNDYLIKLIRTWKPRKPHCSEKRLMGARERERRR